ncbi:hypothetical protein CEXT_679561 [Caerostris extrusa]|uniref:Uncharacterized protein n=1 Tax=Caerostris extrusa TaxID=172846 RepID=A0AAV4XVN7_CAEEX|nr:hypothetical protein CEXT_679561 [Caerostris extrusa]
MLRGIRTRITFPAKSSIFRCLAHWSSHGWLESNSCDHLSKSDGKSLQGVFAGSFRSLPNILLICISDVSGYTSNVWILIAK